MATPDPTHKAYLADGVYARIENGALVLTTENGVSVRDEIHLDVDVLRALDAYRARHGVPIYARKES